MSPSSPSPLPPEGELTTYRGGIGEALSRRRALLAAALNELEADVASLAAMAERVIEALRGGHKVLIAGNGGSAAEAQHFAAELVGRFRHDREPFAALALTGDSSVVTALANDYGYREVFARQIRAIGQPGDLFIAFSTSGESENLVQAVVAARERHIGVIAITGQRPNRLERAADLALRAPAVDTATVQELHMLFTHVVCEVVEGELSATEPDVHE
jgi:D-sedoheptulose 7-phosphate isomerase